MWSLKGFISVIVTAAVLSVPLYYYWDFLTRGMRPPTATQLLNDLEKNGVPNFTLPDLNGQKHSLETFRGKVVLVNIWATWCAPCVKEFPSMKNLVEKFKGDVVVVAASYDKNKEDVESFIRAFGNLPKGFVVLWDQEKTTSKIFGTEVLPETYILNKDLKVIRKVAGETSWDDPMVIEFFKDLMNPQANRDP